MDLKAFIDGACVNPDFVEEQYRLYKENPASLDASWLTFFDQLEGQRQQPKQKAPALSSPIVSDLPSTPSLQPDDTRGRSVLYYPKVEIASEKADWRVYRLVEAYRTYGHLLAQTNPISLHPQEEIPELKLETFGFTKQDLPVRFPSCGLFKEETVPLLDIINALRETYCQKIGVEYIGLQNMELEEWLQKRIEPTRFKVDLSIDQKRMILQYLNKSELFESFLHTKFVGQKRFSLEGGETLIPMLAALIETGSLIGMDEFIIGMAHRGRLNVLSNILDKSYADIFSEFEEGTIPASVEGSGDVKYHKGFYSEIKTVHGHPIKLSLTPNPSHLEAVDPVVEGQVRARQIVRGDELNQEKVVPILIHGDAALSGQGIVYETMQLSRLAGYSTGGTIHIVINNQIGFTTVPEDSRSTRYCTDIAHGFGSPVFHVNAEDPEGCVYAMNLAIELRQKFHCDLFIELNCYRKYGHNETDEPAFTQPLEYQVIRKKKPIRELYRDTLVHQGVVEKDMAESLEEEFKSALHQAHDFKRESAKKSSSSESALKKEGAVEKVQTAVDIQQLQQVGERLCTIPEGFTIHPKLFALTKERFSMLKNTPDAPPLDWGMAELLAYGSLLWEGVNIRLTGQDSCRGTFSHRHALLMDQVKEQGYIPLKHLKEDQGRFDLYNSPLSEYACLGFEFGYSIADNRSLVIWEAQFGDFANGAQIIIDQFIATSEQKWGQRSDLTLFLPHGYEGQGPEHSSGRIERFLTSAGDQNMQIVNPTTPAQLFHLLRRQALRSIQKPLIVFTPKVLLRHPACVSRLDDLTQGYFQEIIDDPTPPKRARRLALCSGRIYYELKAERERTATDDLAIVRIEQLYPLDIEQIKRIISKFSQLKLCLWVQEEPSNMGAWSFMRPILQELLPREIELGYIGRTRSAATATGSHALHKKEHATILNALFNVKDPSIFDIATNYKA